MSEVKKKRVLFPGANIKDLKGFTVPFIFNNAEKIDGSVNYNFNQSAEKGQYEGFFIVPLVAGQITVQLFGQEDGGTFIIDAAEVTAYLGQPLPYRCKVIISGAGTTVNSMNIVW